MKNRIQSVKNSCAHSLREVAGYLIGVMAVAAVFNSASGIADTMAPAGIKIDPVKEQAVFDMPEHAASAFVFAVRNHDPQTMSLLLGHDYREVLPLDEVEPGDVEKFLAAWSERHTLLPEGNRKRLIAIGEHGWTMPIPIVAGEKGWRFDTQEGLDRMLTRRIGRNELAAMQAVLAYYDAQLEYAENDRNGNGMLEYAQQFVSNPGTRNGLYWEVGSGETPSPLGPLMADRTPGGGYHGYHFRILKSQGDFALGGSHSYMIGDQMRGGFAIIAWPAKYGETGVMSFILNHSGIVYERDLGPDGAKAAKAMQVYNPDPGWMPSKEVYEGQLGSLR